MSNADKATVSVYTTSNEDFLKSEAFYTQIEVALLDKYPLLANRAMRIKKWCFPGAGKPANAKAYIETHTHNLEIHFTRVYRLRNEIIHDAATNTIMN